MIKVALADCPIGLFIADGAGLCVKTEYGNNEGRIDAYIVSSGEMFWGAEPQTIASQRAQLVEPIADDFVQRVREMRNAIDMIEGAMQGLGKFLNLPGIFDGCRDDMEIAPRMTVGQMRRVCTALDECTRIINSDEYVLP